jgi:hypothetical protein
MSAAKFRITATLPLVRQHVSGGVSTETAKPCVSACVRERRLTILDDTARVLHPILQSILAVLELGVGSIVKKPVVYPTL